ncbi:MAG: hypothetical protein Q8928_04115 [Bacteroidota bacterium]|nr:hypothetical protein [Bacteroidota bacterium]
MKKFLANWDIIRIIKLVAGIMMMYAAISEHFGALSFLGLFFVIQAITNTGCSACGGSSCEINYDKTQKTK